MLQKEKTVNVQYIIHQISFVYALIILTHYYMQVVKLFVCVCEIQSDGVSRLGVCVCGGGVQFLLIIQMRLIITTAQILL